MRCGNVSRVSTTTFARRPAETQPTTPSTTAATPSTASSDHRRFQPKRRLSAPAVKNSPRSKLTKKTSKSAR